MAAIYRDVHITWGGKEYTVKPTYELINRIESQGVSILSVVNRCARDEIPLTQVAKIFAILLREAGCSVTPAEVYECVMIEADPVFIREMVTLVVTAFFPVKDDQGDEKGNLKAPSKGASGNLKKRKSAGKNTTK